MHILAFSNLFPNACEPFRARFNLQQFAELNRLKDVSVTVVSPIEVSRRLRYKADFKSWGPTGTHQWEGLTVSYPTAFLVPKILRFINGFLMAVSVLPAWLRHRRNPPDVVFSTWAFPDGVAAVLLGRLFKVPVFIKVHGTDVVQLLGRNSLRRSITIRALRRAAGVIAVSKYLRDQLINCGVPAESISTIYNGIDRNIFSPGDAGEFRRKLALSKDGRIGVFVGNLVTIKGLSELLDALTPELCTQFDLSFYIIGAGPLEQGMRQQIKAANMEAVIHLVGQVDHADLADWMNAADFLCLPSYSEGLPNVLLEAFACGLPVVASAVGGIPEIVNADNGRLVPPRDSAALAQAIAETLEMERDQSKISASIEVISWRENADRLFGLFEEQLA